MTNRAKELLEIFKDNDVTTSGCATSVDEQDLVFRLLKRAEIRRVAKGRKSVAEGKPDRISNLLDEAAADILNLRAIVEQLQVSATESKRQIKVLNKLFADAQNAIPYDDGRMIKMFRD